MIATGLSLGASPSRPALPPIQPYHPTTFLERGVVVPFTTPILGGTRARPAEKAGIELVVPNPSGGRGVYVMPWRGISTYCQPTLHDKLLNERVARLKRVSPATIRLAARAVAAEGLAGDEAAIAASAAVEADDNDRLVTNYLLLMALIEQIDELPPGSAFTLGPDTPELKRRAQLATAKVAPAIGMPVSWVATALEELATVLQAVGVGISRASGRVPRLIAMLRRVRDDIDRWSRTQAGQGQSGLAQMICTVADYTIALADAVLGAALTLADDMTGLLREWASGQEKVAELVARPEWLLDGWEPFCLIWDHAADDRARRAAMAEIMPLVPVLPKEALDWHKIANDMDLSFRFRRMIRLNQDWNTGAIVFELIARNEHFRALSC